MAIAGNLTFAVAWTRKVFGRAESSLRVELPFESDLHPVGDASLAGLSLPVSPDVFDTGEHVVNWGPQEIDMKGSAIRERIRAIQVIEPHLALSPENGARQILRPVVSKTEILVVKPLFFAGPP